MEVHDEIIKNRVIMNFNQEGVPINRVLGSLKAMIKEGNFKADAIIIDGFDFSKAQPEDLERVKIFAGDMNLEIWFSASLKGEDPLFNDDGLPIQLMDFMDSCAVVISLAYRGDHVHLQLIKDQETVSSQDLHLKLDPKTLLIVEK